MLKKTVDTILRLHEIVFLIIRVATDATTQKTEKIEMIQEEKEQRSSPGGSTLA